MALTEHSINVDGQCIRFAYDPSTGHLTIPGVVPCCASSLEDARDLVRSLFSDGILNDDRDA